MIVIQVG